MSLRCSQIVIREHLKPCFKIQRTEGERDARARAKVRVEDKRELCISFQTALASP